MIPKSFDLTGKVAVVTGGGKGIGRAAAVALAEAGADVVPTSRTAGDVQEVAAEIRRLGRQTLEVTTDVAVPEQVEEMVEAVMARFGRIDVLVNAAGISPVLKRAEEMTIEEWDQIINVNLRGNFLCCRAVGMKMIETQVRGSIINIASIGGEVAFPRLAAYCASKGGVLQLTRVLAVDWVRFGIRVNAVAPGYIETGMTEGVRRSEKIYADLIRKTPMARFGKPEEITGAVVYLASEASSFVTGSTLTVDGGWLAL